MATVVKRGFGRYFRAHMPRIRATSQTPAQRHEQAAPRRPTPSSAADRRRATQELRALAHPLRLRLIEHFARGPRTTMQVAADLGEPPTRLYHHVNALERAGILRLNRTRQVRGTTEKYFEVAKRKLGIIRARDLTPGARSSIHGLATMVFDEARAELLAAIADPAGLTRDTAPIAFRMLLSVPPSHQKRVRRRIMATVKAIQRELKGCDKASAEGWALTLGFAPTLGKTVGKK
jgi:DNA-binding transcriptional ArsR family regulator